MEVEVYLGWECYVLQSTTLRLLIPRDIGPRILWFGFCSGENLFADLLHFAAELPDGGSYNFYGGHRLWAAPEDLLTTYAADDSPVEISVLHDGLMVTKPVEPQTGLQKSLEILLSAEAQVVIKHQISNCNSHSVTCAPWAITQFRTGGVAILPQSRHDTGILPNRSLTLWSYTDMSNPNMTWGKQCILVRAAMQAPFKVGFSNPRGWLAYWLNGTLFVKRAGHQPQAEYYDFNSSSECYCNDKFLELETLGPITTLEPNQTVSHVETWTLYRDVSSPKDENDVQRIAEALKLE